MAIPHELTVELALNPGLIDQLEKDDISFRGVTRAYREINNRIHRIETLIEPAGSDILDELKRHRGLLKEEIAALVAAKKRAVA